MPLYLRWCELEKSAVTVGECGRASERTEQKKKKISIENKCWNAQHEAQCMHFVCSLFGFVFRRYAAGLCYTLSAHSTQHTWRSYLHVLQSRRAHVVCKLLQLSTSVKCILRCVCGWRWWMDVWIVASIHSAPSSDWDSIQKKKCYWDIGDSFCSLKRTGSGYELKKWVRRCGGCFNHLEKTLRPSGDSCHLLSVKANFPRCRFAKEVAVLLFANCFIATYIICVCALQKAIYCFDQREHSSASEQSQWMGACELSLIYLIAAINESCRRYCTS